MHVSVQLTQNNLENKKSEYHEGYSDGMSGDTELFENPSNIKVYGHPNRKLSCISLYFGAAILKQPPFHNVSNKCTDLG